GALESADAIAGSRVLDLYAGSGALGLEALSRGAASVELVERSRPAAAVLRCNVATVPKALSDRSARVHESAVLPFLRRTQGLWGLVFSVAPYAVRDAAMTADLSAVAPRLSDGAVVVIERAKRSTPPDVNAAGLEVFREK